MRVLPVVEQDVRGPDLVRGEAEVLHPGMFALVPLEIVVKPTLKRTEAHTACLPLHCSTGNRRYLQPPPGLHVRLTSIQYRNRYPEY